MSLFDTKCTTNIDLANRLKSVATDYKTLYVMGCFGAPMTQKNKARYCKNHSYNKQEKRTAMIQAATEDTFGFDCVCLIKGILWGWCGDVSKTYGGASYKANSVPDISADSMIKKCSNLSTDFTKIEIGEAVWMEGHIGVYVGDGLAVECTPKWDNKVQITACNQSISGYNRRNWTKHGKLPYIEYVKEQQEELQVFEELDVVKIKDGVTKYSNGKTMASWVPSYKLYVREYNGQTTVVSTLKEGAVTGTCWTKDLVLVEKATTEEVTVKPVITVAGTPSTGSAEDQKVMWDFLLSKFENEFAVAGFMGNLYAECGLRSNNLQQTYEKKLGYTDTTYTSAVDSGEYTNFIKDSAGYGLAQWTYWSRKEMLLNFAKEANKSIGDYQMQLDFLWYELEKNFKSLVKSLKATTSVREASDLVLHKFEQPADQSEAVEVKRAGYGQTYYDKFHVIVEEPKVEVIPEPEVITVEEKNTLMKLIEAVIDFILGLFKKSK